MPGSLLWPLIGHTGAREKVTVDTTPLPAPLWQPACPQSLMEVPPPSSCWSSLAQGAQGRLFCPPPLEGMGTVPTTAPATPAGAAPAWRPPEQLPWDLLSLWGSHYTAWALPRGLSGPVGPQAQASVCLLVCRHFKLREVEETGTRTLLSGVGSWSDLGAARSRVQSLHEVSPHPPPHQA